MDDAQPWYAKGLRFQCTQCGDCCSGAPGYVWVVNEEIAAIAAELKMEVADFEAKYVRKVGVRKSLIEYSNGDCVFLKDRKCTVYNARPRQCRTWPFWDSNLRSRETWEHTCEVCPGAGKGQIVQLGEIERQRTIVKV